jgi:hypothetical protein
MIRLQGQLDPRVSGSRVAASDVKLGIGYGQEGRGWVGTIIAVIYSCPTCELYHGPLLGSVQQECDYFTVGLR